MKKNVCRLTAAEKEWSQKASKRCMKNGKISFQEIRRLKICEEFKNKFGRSISDMGMYSRFVKMYPGLKRGTNPAEVSNYLVFVKLTGQMAGFETEQEVKNFVEQNQIIGNNLRVFKYVPINIEYNVNIG